MSLVGNLEDLGFGDILQIINLSRKSGVFLVQEGTRKAKILFRSGQVLAAFNNFERQDLCARLLASGEADDETVSRAVRRFRQQGGRAAITACLVDAGVSREIVEREVRAEIEGAVIAIFGWEEGEFSFELKEIEEDLQRARANPYRLVLERGINPQFLAMEGTRLSDEARRNGRAAPAGEAAATASTGGTAEARAVAPRAEAGPAAPEAEADAASGPAPGAAREDGPRAAAGAEAPGDRDVVEARAEPAPPSPPPPEIPASPESAVADAEADAPAQPATPAPAPAPGQGPPVVLVDDDVRFLDLVRSALVGCGHRVECFEDGGAAHAWLEQNGGGEPPLCVVSDLIMPRTDGEGILGGLELLERVRSKHRTLPFVLFTDHPHEDAEQRARLLDVDFVLAKPRSAEISGGEGSRGIDGFLGALQPILESFRKQRRAPRAEAPPDPPETAAGAGESEAPQAAAANAGPEADPGSPEAAEREEAMLDLRSTLLPEIEEGDEAFQWPENGTRETQPGLAVLRSMLCELSSPIAGGQISLLVLRFAAEMMSRAVIFMASEDEVVGLGQFGIAPPAGKPDRRVRSIRIPLGEPSVFHDVVTKQSVLRGPLDENRWNRHLIECLGGGRPLDAFVAPIVAGGKVVAVLYGDNLPEQRPVQNTEWIEIFLTQAGVAFEKAILERRIRELNVGP